MHYSGQYKKIKQAITNRAIKTKQNKTNQVSFQTRTWFPDRCIVGQKLHFTDLCIYLYRIPNATVARRERKYPVVDHINCLDLKKSCKW